METSARHDHFMSQLCSVRKSIGSFLRHRRSRSHDLVLGQAAMRVGIHTVAAATRSSIFDEAEAERSSAVLVALELGNGSVGSLCRVETNHARAPGSTAWLILNLGLLDLADRAKELDKILVRSGPRQLRGS